MFTEKEKSILQALLEDELNSISVNYVGGKDELINRYYLSLARILMKVRLEESEMTDPAYFDALTRQLASRQAV